MESHLCPFSFTVFGDCFRKQYTTYHCDYSRIFICSTVVHYFKSIVFFDYRYFITKYFSEILLWTSRHLYAKFRTVHVWCGYFNSFTIEGASMSETLSVPFDGANLHHWMISRIFFWWTGIQFDKRIYIVRLCFTNSFDGYHRWWISKAQTFSHCTFYKIDFPSVIETKNKVIGKLDNEVFISENTDYDLPTLFVVEGEFTTSKKKMSFPWFKNYKNISKMQIFFLMW